MVLIIFVMEKLVVNEIKTYLREHRIAGLKLYSNKVYFGNLWHFKGLRAAACVSAADNGPCLFISLRSTSLIKRLLFLIYGRDSQRYCRPGSTVLSRPHHHQPHSLTLLFPPSVRFSNLDTSKQENLKFHGCMVPFVSLIHVVWWIFMIMYSICVSEYVLGEFSGLYTQFISLIRFFG